MLKWTLSNSFSGVKIFLKSLTNKDFKIILNELKSPNRLVPVFVQISISCILSHFYAFNYIGFGNSDKKKYIICNFDYIFLRIFL